MPNKPGDWKTGKAQRALAKKQLLQLWKRHRKLKQKLTNGKMDEVLSDTAYWKQLHGDIAKIAKLMLMNIWEK